MKRTISLLLALIFVSSLLAACGADPAVGTYTLETIGGKTPVEWMKESVNGSEQGLESLLELFGVTKDDLNENFYTLTLENDGKASVCSAYASMYAGAAVRAGTWSIEGDVLTVSLDGETEIFTFKNGVLTREFNGEEGVFKKK